MNNLLLSFFLLAGLPEHPYMAGIKPADELFSGLETRGPAWQVFQKAYEGYMNIHRDYQANPDKQFLTIIDLTLPSNKKRLWVIDLSTGKILYNTYAAHGKNSGDLFARTFSNNPGSHQSSLGFYLTGTTYTGRNGYSLYLEGIDNGFNHLARERAIVMHGAWYATEKFISKYGRLGRSYGCPAIPPVLSRNLIDTISGGTVLFMYYNDEKYLQSTTFLPH